MNTNLSLNPQDIVQNGPIYNPNYLNLEYFFHRVYDFFSGILSFLGIGGGNGGGGGPGEHMALWLKTLLVLLIIGLIFLICFLIVRIYELINDQKKKVRTYTVFEEKIEKKNTRWEKVLEHSESFNSSDWRWAIIEADIMLDEALTEAGHQGENIAEKLKSAQNFLKTIQYAWDAHKVRNLIAHEGSNFEISQHETKRAVSLFEMVLTELHFI
ncbi:MAG: hypothetical protein WDK96_02640 [Candidatus Paceibacterota bacterium]|jgi:hypothetical protein